MGLDRPAAFGFMSAYDPPAISGAPFLTRFFSLGPGFTRLFFHLVKSATRRWGPH
jgi:hypothetical protein